MTEKRAYIRWTAEDDRNLAKWYKQGLTWERIAGSIGKSLRNCQVRANRIGITNAKAGRSRPRGRKAWGARLTG